LGFPISQSPCGELHDLFFTTGVRQVDPTFLESVEDGADRLRPAKRHRHLRIDPLGHLLQVVEVMAGEENSLLHDSGVFGEPKSLP